MAEENEASGFERIYATDLVYVSDCWKLCGNAHCCNFGRYKSNFKLIARTPFQELPLLPGEYEFLASKGWLEQFGDHDHKIVRFEIDGYVLKAESIISRNKGCACEHSTRPTICRLYPLLPRFDVGGQLVGTEPMGIYEEMEQIAGIEPACALTALPFSQLEKFLAIANELRRNPVHVFYVMAYSATKRHVSARLKDKFSSEDRDIFSLFEAGFIRSRLIDTDVLRTDLSNLARMFEDRYGALFSNALSEFQYSDRRQAPKQSVPQP